MSKWSSLVATPQHLVILACNPKYSEGRDKIENSCLQKEKKKKERKAGGGGRREKGEKKKVSSIKRLLCDIH